MSAHPDDPDDEALLQPLQEEATRDRDGISSLHDTDSEAGDEQGLDDSLLLDSREARELGVNLDDVQDEPPLS